jgi:hypothetical protein
MWKLARLGTRSLRLNSKPIRNTTAARAQKARAAFAFVVDYAGVFCVFAFTRTLSRSRYWWSIGPVPAILRHFGNGDNSNLGRHGPYREIRSSGFRVDRDWDLLAPGNRVDDPGSASRAQAETRNGGGFRLLDDRADTHGS